MLTIEELTTDYGPIRAVDHVSLEVPEGSVIAVLARTARARPRCCGPSPAWCVRRSDA